MLHFSFNLHYQEKKKDLIKLQTEFNEKCSNSFLAVSIRNNNKKKTKNKPLFKSNLKSAFTQRPGKPRLSSSLNVWHMKQCSIVSRQSAGFNPSSVDQTEVSLHCLLTAHLAADILVLFFIILHLLASALNRFDLYRIHIEHDADPRKFSTATPNYELVTN